MSSDSAKILVVEDSLTQAERLRHILEQQGYEVAIAGNGVLALQRAVEFQPDLVMSDVNMPEMDGYELSRRIKTDPRFCGIPVILVTSMSDPQDVIRGLESGADNFVLKPYEERYLLGRVRFVLVNREMSRPEDAGMGVGIFFNGQRHFITADRLQILNLLLSTYDAAIQRNKELEHGQDNLQALNAKLAAANRELDSFSMFVSHELRAPLRHITGYVELLRDESAIASSSEALRHVNAIANASRQMAQLIDDLLEFSRTNRAELGESAIELETLVHRTIGELEATGQGRPISWKVGALPAVIGDPALLRQVFSNLLGNAIKYTRPRVEAQIEIGCAGEEDGQVVLFVRDNGVGFDMKYADKLFGVFQRLHRADEFEGTGIGLATVRQIVAKHGGRTWAEGKPGEGATFYLTLSRERRQSRTPASR